MELYAMEENELIKSFGYDVQKGLIKPEITDLSSKETQRKYNSYIDSIAAFKPREYQTSDFSDIKYEDFINLTIQIIEKIFGNIDIKAELIEFFNTIHCSNSPEILNGIALTIKDDKNKITRITEIPNVSKISSIVTIIHEFIHFHCHKMNMDFNKKTYYEEILSIYAEKMAASVISNLQRSPEFLRKIEETRLESIVWHYKVHPSELAFAIESYNEAKRHSKDPEFRKYMGIVENNLPWIKSPSRIKTVLQYKENLRASYGLGYLYAESLLRYYIMDPKITETAVRQTLVGDKTLKELLDYFDISANNDQVYDRVQQKLSILRRY